MLSYGTTKEFNKIIDEGQPSHPHFHHHEVVVAGEAYDVYFHDILECVRALYGDPGFTPVLVFAPEHNYANKDKTDWLFHDIHTGKWWWETQGHDWSSNCDKKPIKLHI